MARDHLENTLEKKKKRKYIRVSWGVEIKWREDLKNNLFLV